MSILGKLAFWKKKDDFSDLSKDPFSSDLGQGDPFGTGQSGPGADPYAQQGGGGADPYGAQGGDQSQRPFGNLPDPSGYRGASVPQGPQQGFSDAGSFTSDKGYSSFSPSAPSPTHRGHEMEMINAKLDAIRAQIDSINTRLLNIERIAQAEQGNTPYQW